MAEAKEGTSELEALQRSISEKDEELQTWRIRALQAEAEVRALKRTRHSAERPAALSEPDMSDRADSSPVRPLQALRVESATQTDMPGREQGRLASSDSSALGMDVDELRQQLKQKETAIVQLQADSHREQQARDKQAAEKQRKAAEQQQMYREELREMTQRAELLRDQLRSSKKRGGELQAAQEAAREEFLQAQAELQESEARLQRQGVLSEAEAEEAQRRQAEARGFSSRQEVVLQLSEVEEESDAKEALKDIGPGEEASRERGQVKVAHCAQTLRKLHTELSKELQSRKDGQGKASDEVLSKIFQQLDKAQLLLDGPSPVGEGRAFGPVSLSIGSRQPSSPEAERPIPEDFKGTSPASLGLPQSKDSEEVLLMKLDVNAVRIAAELDKEKLIAEHCDQLDDLVSKHDKERKELHREVAEMRSESARAEVNEMLLKPMHDISAHFEKQVTQVKQELVAQLADIQERNRMQSGQAEQEMAVLKRDLDRCQKELSARDHEFHTLAMLLDKEKEETYRLRQQQRELLEEQACQTAACAASNASDVANMNALVNSVDFSPDTTVVTDIVPLGVADKIPERPAEKVTEAIAAGSTATLPAEEQAVAQAVAQAIPAPLPAPTSAVKAMKLPKKEEGRECAPVLSATQAQTQARPAMPVSVLRTALPIANQSRTLPAALGPSLPTPQTPGVGVRAVVPAQQLHRLATTANRTTHVIQQHHRSASASG